MEFNELIVLTGFFVVIILFLLLKKKQDKGSDYKKLLHDVLTKNKYEVKGRFE